MAINGYVDEVSPLTSLWDCGQIVSVKKCAVTFFSGIEHSCVLSLHHTKQEKEGTAVRTTLST